jgi:hypothetical protein
LRAWSTLFSSGDGAATSGSTGGGQAVQRGIELAYRVSDEYIRQGQSLARALSQPFSPKSSPSGAGAPGNTLPHLTERMLRYSSELSSMWMEAMRMMSNSAGANAGAAPFAPASPAPTPRQEAAPSASPEPRAGREAIAIEVDSSRRTRAELDLRGKAKGSISVGPLRHEGGTAKISNVRTERNEEDGRVTVLVRVPQRQKPGTYVADIFDSTRATVGAVTVRVAR